MSNRKVCQTGKYVKQESMSNKKVRSILLQAECFLIFLICMEFAGLCREPYVMKANLLSETSLKGLILVPVA